MVDQDKKMKALTGAADKAATELSYTNILILILIHYILISPI